MNALIYTRVSTEEQATSGFSLDSQEKYCREHCARQGWNIVQVFREEGESAKTADRTQLIKLLDYCHKNRGKIDVLLVQRLDRFSRNTADHQMVRAVLSKLNVVLRSVSENIDETSTGKFIENIFSAVAQWDNDTRSDKTKWGLQEKVRQGFWAWKAPIGYKNTPAGIIIDAVKAPIILKTFETYSQTGYTLKDMAQKMNRWGLRSAKGNKLTPQSVDHILRNKLYMGVIEVRGWKDEVQGLHEKIIEPALFYRVKAVREGKSFTSVPRLVKNPDFPLKNIAKCDACGEYLTGSWSKGRNKRYAYYHCLCGKTRISKNTLEEIFYSTLKDIQPNSDFKKLFKEILYDVWKQKQSEKLSILNKVTKEVAKLREMKERLLQKNLDGVVDDEDYKRAKSRLDQEIVIKEVERSDSVSEETNIDYLVSLSESLFDNAATIWLDAPFEYKLRFQTLMFPKGVIYKNESIGTAELGLPFALIGDVASSKTNLVPLAGFEPAICAMRTHRPRPLDDRGYL